MALVLIVGIALIGAACGLFARGILLSRFRASVGLRGIADYGVQPLQPGVRDASESVLRHATDRLQARLAKLGDADGTGASLRLRLQAAGFYTTTPAQFVGKQVFGALAFMAIWGVTAFIVGTGFALGLLGALVALLVGWTLPLVELRERARTRAQQIDYEMPELIDMLVTTVRAGVAFGASLQMASERFRGPLGEELRLALQEQNMGLGLHGALTNLVARQNAPSVRSFVRAILQGEQLGVSVGQTLRVLAEEMRARRRQRAEEQAHKAPVKLVFPLVLCMFPAMFVIVLGPAMIRVFQIFQ